MTIPQQVAFAKSIIGKTYQWKKTAPSKVVSVHVTINRDSQSQSQLVNEVVEDDGICVFITDHIGCTLPVKSYHFHEYVEPKPDFIEVKLNDSYTAKVYLDKIVVGCQTFPIDTLDKLNVARLEIAKLKA